MFTVVINQEALNTIIFTSIYGMEVDIPKFNLMFTVVTNQATLTPNPQDMCP
jgi:hypothetical protein